MDSFKAKCERALLLRHSGPDFRPLDNMTFPLVDRVLNIQFVGQTAQLESAGLVFCNLFAGVLCNE
jgi:hypothetical protein